MIGSLKIETEQDRQAIVVGAGVSGLLIAYVLDQQGFKVTLIEESKRAGGLISTQSTEWGPAESAAHSFLVTDEIAEICRDLGVELCPVRPDARSRYIYRRGKMRRFPLSFFELIRTFLRAYLVLSRADLSRGSATLEQWGNRHLGKSAVKYLLSPFLTGIYAARPSEICVSAAFPALEVPAGQSLLSALLRKLRLRLLSSKKKSAPKSQSKKMMAPKMGMGALVGALERRLEERLGDRFRKGETVSVLPDSPNVILAVPASRASALLAQKDSRLSQALSEIEYAPLVSATIFISKAAFSSLPRGVGVLFPEAEKRDCLGVLFNSSAFSDRVRDEAEWVSLTMMLGGTIRPEMIKKADHELFDLIRNELKILFGLDDSSVQSARIVLNRWTHAIPKYDQKTMAAWNAARSGWCSVPGHVLTGNYTGQISIRGMMQEACALGTNLAAGLHV